MLKHLLLTNLQICFMRDNLKNLQQIRWRRKPRWLPVAKSKMFLVPPRTVTPENERIELMRLYNNYNTRMKAIRSYLHEQHNVKSVIIDTEEHEREFMEEFVNTCKINDMWNEKQRKERELRHTKELELAKQTAYKNMDERSKIKKELFDSVEEMVRKEKEASSSFITAESLDNAIENALANPVDYNYAIDLDGNFYRGRHNKGERDKPNN